MNNHIKNNRSLFAILFPSEYNLLKEEDDQMKLIKISEEKKKEILLNFMLSIFGERNNYPLFKYLYLTPARSLKYINLYSEIASYLDLYNNNQFNTEKLKEKEKKYIEFLEKEKKSVIDSSIKRDNEETAFLSNLSSSSFSCTLFIFFIDI